MFALLKENIENDGEDKKITYNFKSQKINKFQNCSADRVDVGKSLYIKIKMCVFMCTKLQAVISKTAQPILTKFCMDVTLVLKSVIGRFNFENDPKTID